MISHKTALNLIKIAEKARICGLFSIYSAIV